MEPHQIRVIEEKGELDKKLDKLSSFLSQDKPPYVDTEEWKLLQLQQQQMTDYSDTLANRINLFN